ncbi:hypothetical protein SNEBB_005825 [Seison nebaliae]|nr:hypothetical protein SNEBB_005825 [Seison nebaliae]
MLHDRLVDINYFPSEIPVSQQESYDLIIDLLISAGYFRARIRTLTPFDKIIGGIVWCIQTTCFQLNIDIFFREEMTIGKKILVTERIVNVLKKMNCRYIIEPHEIQGLNCNKMIDLIRWLIQEALQYRSQMKEKYFDISYFYNSRIDQMKFERNYQNNLIPLRQFELERNELVENQMRMIKHPQRLYRLRKMDKLKDIDTLIDATLLEYNEELFYGYASSSHEQIGKSNEKESTKNKQKIIRLKKVMEEYDEKISIINEENLEKIMNENKWEFDEMKELSDPLMQMERKIGKMKNKLENIRNENNDINPYLWNEENMVKLMELKERLKESEKVEEKLKKKFDEVDVNSNEIMKRLYPIIDETNKEKISLKENKHEISELRKEFEKLNKSDDRNSLELELKNLKDNRIVQEKEEEPELKKMKGKNLKLEKENLIYRYYHQSIANSLELTYYGQLFHQLAFQTLHHYRQTKYFYIQFNLTHDVNQFLTYQFNLTESISEACEKARTMNDPSVYDHVHEEIEKKSIDIDERKKKMMERNEKKEREYMEFEKEVNRLQSIAERYYEMTKELENLIK